MILEEKANMSTSEYLMNLPTRDKANFSKIEMLKVRISERYTRNNVYVPTTDHKPEQHIVTDRTNILLNFLHKQWEKEEMQLQRKRPTTSTEVPPCAKKLRQA